MPLFVADYLGDTSHLTTLEHGAYMLLIMSYWQRGKALSADSKRLASIARVPADEWAAIEPAIAEFFVCSQGVWAHKRIEHELSKYRRKEVANGLRLPRDEWATLRMEIFIRDEFTCRYCGETGVALECDHVIPVSRGGNHSESNLVTSCVPCNRAKHAKIVSIEEFSAQRRAAR